jgi:D-arabinose 1-dehydrogenase-like Zn-dependent alcohol dehydrogenase
MVKDDPVVEVKAVAKRTPRAVLDFVGRSETAQLGLDLLRRSGHLTVVGLYGGEIAVCVSSLAMRNVTIRGSNVGTLQESHDLVALLQSTRLRPIPVHGRPMPEVNDVCSRKHDWKDRSRATGELGRQPPSNLMPLAES